MRNRRRICVVTGTRAEYGNLFWLLRKLKSDKNVDLSIIATGMHLSPEFGETYKEIIKDGFNISHKVEMLLSGDTSASIGKSTGLGVIGFSDAFEYMKPGVVIVMGDRFEIFSASIAAYYANIPIVHIGGGEVTAGAIDEALRHSITKMARLHFVSTEQYRKRVIQLGENPSNVFYVGGPIGDNIRRRKLLSRNNLEKTLGIKFLKKNLLVTYHPATLEKNTARNQFVELLEYLRCLDSTLIIITKSNADAEGRGINELIDQYADAFPDIIVPFHSMGQLNYLSTMQYVDAIIGNSSSGITEAPSFGIGTVNIGSRQQGRVAGRSVINCEPNKRSINEALKKLYSKNFKQTISKAKNPYDGGISSDKIFDIIMNFDFSRNHKKEFFDL